MLVRHKNALIDDAAVVDAVALLVLQNPDGLKNSLLRLSYCAVRNVSYRFTNVYRTICGTYLRWRLRKEIIALLDAYRNGKISFAQAKNRLRGLMLQQGTVEYIQPSLGKMVAKAKD